MDVFHFVEALLRVSHVVFGGRVGGPNPSRLGKGAGQQEGGGEDELSPVRGGVVDGMHGGMHGMSGC